MPATVTPTDIGPAMVGHVESLTYAGFWRRGFALTCDLGLLFIADFLLSVAMGAEGRLVPFDSYGHTGLYYVLCTVIAWLYFAGFEGAGRHATPGKRVVGVAVVTAEGGPVGFGRATTRFVAKFVSLLMLGIGLMAAGIDPRKQGWHDHIADTMVVALR